jgi:uncharacterized protein YgiB involved in biofilm formation
VDDSRVTVSEATSNEAMSASLTSTGIDFVREPKLRANETLAVPAARAKRMRSLNLTLVLMGTAALGGLTGCGNLESNKSTSRDVYANLEACKADWGNPGDCEEVASTTSGHSSGVGSSRSFYGPRYSSRSGSTGYSSDARPGSRASGTISSSSVSRGGFGASASRHGGGSSSSSSSHSSGG